MKNPCKECIVQASCRYSCDEFLKYFRKASNQEGLHSMDPKIIADLIREGAIYLYDNDKEWTWTINNKNE